MTSFVDDTAVSRPRHDPAGSGLVLAVASAASFGLSGPLASGLIGTGWSPAAVVLVRMGLAALVLAVPASLSLRGRWRALRAAAPAVLLYGLFAVAGAQFCYFSAVASMDVGPALLIEYTSPAAVVLWLWVRHGRRPQRWTLAGAAVAALGLVLVLGLLSGAHVAGAGVVWALGAMLGATVYFVLSAAADTGVPPLGLAGAGLLVGTAALALLAGLGLLPVRTAASAVTYGGAPVPWWLPLVGLGLVTAAFAYVTGIAASRLLGSQVASFVALLEVVSAIAFAWLLLGQHPGSTQLLGALFVVAGVLVVKLADRPVERAALTAPRRG